jgi:hypothetical protein
MEIDYQANDVKALVNDPKMLVGKPKFPKENGGFASPDMGPYLCTTGSLIKEIKSKLSDVKDSNQYKEAWLNLFHEKQKRPEPRSHNIDDSDSGSDSNSDSDSDAEGEEEDESDEVRIQYLMKFQKDYTKKQMEGKLEEWLEFTTRIGPISRCQEMADRLFHDCTTATDVQQKHNKLRIAFEKLRSLFLSRKMCSRETPEGSSRLEKVEKISKNLDNLFAYKLLQFDLVSGSKIHLVNQIPILSSVKSSFETQLEEIQEKKQKWSIFALLLDAFLNKTKQMGLVRIDTKVCEEILTKDGIHTRTYRPWKERGDIVEFILHCVTPMESNPELFGYLFHSPTNWSHLAKVLSQSQDERFPVKIPKRNLYSTLNGFYDLDYVGSDNVGRDKFIEYGSAESENLPDDFVPCMYIPHKFDNALYEWYIYNSPRGWYDIPTSALQRICDLQKWEQDECEWWYAGGGRMLYPARAKEEWARMWLHIGRAGCGKSKSIEMFLSFIPKDKIGLLNNNCEKVFTLQGLKKTWVWAGMDIKEDWNLDQTLWNTMVDGGSIPIAEKFKTAELMEFNQHGAIATNRLMNWQDTANNLMRRLFPHWYRFPPTEKNGVPNLVQEMWKDPCAALKKLNIAYKAKCLSHGSGLLRDSILPRNVVRNLRELQQMCNPLMAFLDSQHVRCEKHFYMEKSRFMMGLVKFVRDNNHRKLPPVTESFFADVLEVKSCFFTTKPEEVPWENGSIPPSEINSKKMWVVGCCLVEDAYKFESSKRPNQNHDLVGLTV